MIQKKLLLFFMLLSVVMTSCHDDDDDLIGLWTKYSDFPGTPRYGASSFTITANNQSYGYVIGGYDTNAKPMKDMYVYKMDQYRWDRVTSEFPGISRQFAIAVGCENNGKGYYGLGYYPNYDDGTTLNKYGQTEELDLYTETTGRLWDWWVFDPDASATTGQWTRLPDFPGTARYDAIGFCIGNKIYVGTGFDNEQGVVDDIYAFDVTTNTWDPVHIGFNHKVRGASVFVIDDIAYVVGGQANSDYIKEFYSFNPDRSQQWVRLRDVYNTSDEDYDDDYTIIRQNASTFVIDGYGYITCGNSGSLRTDTWEYNPTTDLWEKVNKFKGSAREYAVSFSTGRKEGAFVVTGRSSSSSAGYFDDMWNLDPYQWDDDDY